MAERRESDQVTHPLFVASQAAKVGLTAALPGTIFGAYMGTLRSNTPVIFSLVSGLQWFAIGSTFWTVRTSIIHNVGLRNWWNITRGAPLLPGADTLPSRSERIRASTISGGVTGAVLGMAFRGPQNVIPGTIMFTLFGFGGQHAVEWYATRNAEITRTQIQDEEDGVETVEKENWLQRAARSKYSPMSVLTDEQYEGMLNEKLLSVEAEIALIDDKIQESRRKQKEAEKVQGPGTSQNQDKK